METNSLKIGMIIEVSAFRGARLKRRVVEIIDRTIYVCKEEEWESAKQQNREPTAVGFPLKDVISIGL